MFSIAFGVVLFFLLVVLEQIHGFSHIAISASLARNARITATGWRKITSWAVPQFSGHIASSTSITDGDLKAPVSGLYNVFTTVTFSTSNIGLFKLAVLINNDFQNLHTGLQSSLERAEKSQSLSVFGTVRLQRDDSLSVFMFSDLATNWTLAGNSETTFSVEFIGYYSYIPGFSSHLSIQSSVQTTNWVSLLRWRSYGGPGLFQSRTGFSADSGTFAPICNGVYQISANVEYFVHVSGKFSLAIAINGDVTGSVLEREIAGENVTFSLTLSLAYNLKKGDLVSLMTTGSSPYKINTNSGFFGILVNEGGSIPGFSTVYTSPINGNGKNWINIPLATPTANYGQFDAIPGSIKAGRFYHTARVIYTVSALLHIKATSSTGIILTLEDENSVLSTVTGIFTTRSHSSDVTTYSIAGILELPVNQPLLLHAHLSNQEQYAILKGSRVSVTTTHQQYQAFHLVEPSPTEFSESNIWIKLENLKVSGDGSFVFTNTYSNGKYVAAISGIYYFAANVIFQDVHGPIGLVISVKGDTSKRRSLHATKGNPAVTRDSISVTGALYVQAGLSVAVYVMVENDLNWSIDTKSSFSVAFIGQRFGVPGVSTVLKERKSYTTTGWRRIKGWEVPRNDGVMFDAGGTFDATEGLYVAPQTGLYLVSVCLKMEDASAKSSTFIANIAINGDPSVFGSQNGLQHYIENNFDPPLTNDYYSLVIGGVVKVDKGQTISIHIYSVLDNAFSVSPDSSFSVVYLSPLDSIYGSGMQIMLSDSIAQSVKDASSWKKVRYWVTQRTNTAPGLFFQGNLLELDSDGGTIRILESGLYLINVNIAIGDGDKEFEIGIHTTTGLAALSTKYGQTPRLKYTMKVYGIMYFSEGQILSVRIRSTGASTSWEQLQLYSGLSIVRIPPFIIAPSINSGLKSVTPLQTAQSLWSRVRYWRTNTATTQELSGPGFNGENGYFVAEYEGIYLVSCSISFKLDQSGFQIVRMKIGLNADISLPGVKQFHESVFGASHLISNCDSECAEPLTQLFYLTAGDRVAVYVQSNVDTVEMLSSTSFVVKYLSPRNPIRNGFSMQLSAALTVRVYGDKQVTGWTTTTDSGQFYQDTGVSKNDYRINEDGLYLVSVNIEFVDVLGLATAASSLDNIPALVATHYTDVETSFTISVVGIMKVSKDSVYTVTIQTDEDQDYIVSQGSTSSLAYLGLLADALGFTATFNRKHTSAYQKDTWHRIGGWSTVGKDWLFLNGNGFESKQSYIVQESGFYVVAANMIFLASFNTSAKIELSLVHNNLNIANSLYGSTILIPNKVSTVQVHGGVYLNQWDFLELQFKLDRNIAELSIEQESTFSIMKTGDDISSMPCSDFGPNIVGRINPDNIRLERGSSIAWNCFATGDNPTYQWTKFMILIPGATGTKLEKTDLKVSDSGEYVCSASAAGIITFSNIAQLTVFDPFPRYLNAPTEFHLEIPENGPAKADLLYIMAKAESFESEYSDMTFELISGDVANQFEISPLSSKEGTTLSRVKTFDREVIANYLLQIATTNPLKPLSPAIQNITINVIDLNDNPPIFEQRTYNVTILESTAPSTTILTVSAADADERKNAIIQYTLIPGTSNDIFSVNLNTGDVVLKRSVNREERSWFVLSIKATDGVFEDFTEVTIFLADINEFKPRFLQHKYTVEVPETVVPGVPMLRILAVDEDTGNNSKIMYIILRGDPANTFMISELGDLQATDYLDHETNATYHLVIGLQDYGSPPLVSDETANVTVIVRDQNDNRPIFTQPEYKGYIKENSLVFDPVLTVTARDPDGGGIDAITYGIPAEHNLSSIFDVVTLNGNIEVKKPLDFEHQRFYQFTVQAFDTGLPPKVSTANVLVEVIDMNDNKPIFETTNHQVQITESSDTGRVIYQVSATDRDTGANGIVNYKIVAGNIADMFHINPFSGAIFAQRPLDRETVSYYNLEISAFDAGSPSQVSVNEITLEVTVLDTNDNSPVYDKSEYFIRINEDALVGSTLTIITVVDYDSGANGEFNVTVFETSFQSVFTITHISGSLYGLVLLKALNFEERSLYTFTVLAKDSGTPSMEKAVSVTVKVLDVNDNFPKFQSNFYATTLTDAVYANLTIIQMVATDPDVGPDGKLSYEIIAGNIAKAFSIGYYTGIVRTAVRKNLTFIPTYQLHIIAKDSFDPPKVSNSTILHIRVTKTPAIILTDTTIGQFQIKTQIDMSELSHLIDVVKYEVIVQQYLPKVAYYTSITSQEPVSWHVVFSKTALPSDEVRRYIAISAAYPASKPKTISVLIGNNLNCTSLRMVNEPICNGPLAAGRSYRLQVRVYENRNPVPVESHFTYALDVPALELEKATLQEPIEDGMVALAATFCVIIGVVIAMILAYTFWKVRHEIVHVDHLREPRGIPRDQALDSSGFFPSPIGKIQKFGGFDGGSMWPQLSMTEQNQLFHRSKQAGHVTSQPPTGGRLYDFNPQYNFGYEEVDGDDDDGVLLSFRSEETDSESAMVKTQQSSSVNYKNMDLSQVVQAVMGSEISPRMERTIKL